MAACGLPNSFNSPNQFWVQAWVIFYEEPAAMGFPHFYPYLGCSHLVGELYLRNPTFYCPQTPCLVPLNLISVQTPVMGQFCTIQTMRVGSPILNTHASPSYLTSLPEFGDLGVMWRARHRVLYLRALPTVVGLQQLQCRQLWDVTASKKPPENMRNWAPK